MWGSSSDSDALKESMSMEINMHACHVVDFYVPTGIKTESCFCNPDNVLISHIIGGAKTGFRDLEMRQQQDEA